LALLSGEPQIILDLTSESWTAIGTIALALVGAGALIANVFVVRATKDQADATLNSAQATLQEAKQVSAQVVIGRQQADIAQRTLDAQSQPQLFPGDKENWQHDPAEPSERSPTQSINPVSLRIINVGNGAAILDPAQSKAACVTEQGEIGPMGLRLPPVIAAREIEWITLIPQFGDAFAPRGGLIYTVTLGYHAFAKEELTWLLSFSARYINEDRWEVTVAEA
jgi:hypothetical protein